MPVITTTRDMDTAGRLIEPFGPMLLNAVSKAIAEERERCAQVAEKLHEKPGWSLHYKNAAAAIADLIRKP